MYRHDPHATSDDDGSYSDSESGSDSGSDVAVDAPTDPAARRAQAAALKDTGNRHFRAGDYERAADFYRAALGK